MAKIPAWTARSRVHPSIDPPGLYPPPRSSLLAPRSVIFLLRAKSRALKLNNSVNGNGVSKDSHSSFDVEPVCSHVKRITWIIEGGIEEFTSKMNFYSSFFSLLPKRGPLLILVFTATVLVHGVSFIDYQLSPSNLSYINIISVKQITNYHYRKMFSYNKFDKINKFLINYTGKKNYQFLKFLELNIIRRKKKKNHSRNRSDRNFLPTF